VGAELEKEMNGAESLVETLVAGGVEVCFANPGTSEMHFLAALDRTRKMRCVLGLFEGVVTGAADGYARMAGKPAATLLHLAPGFGNGSANLHNARKARTPLINVVGDHATYHAALDAPLAADVEGAARPFSHWVRTSRNAREVATDGAAALSAATSHPGQVATLILPADTAWSEAGGIAPIPEPLAPQPIDERAVEAAAGTLEGPEATLLMVGGSVLRDATALALAGAIARRTGAHLMAATANARIERGAGRVFVETIPYPVDMALERLATFRRVILIEAKEPVAFFAYPEKPSRVLPPAAGLIQLASPDQLGGDALAMLAERLGVRADGAPLESLDRPAAPDSGELTPDALGRAVAVTLPEHAVVADEGITGGVRVFPITRTAAPHSWMRITGGSIGIGIPLATGAAVACPERRVLSIQADGSACYTPQGLWTQAREGLNVTTLLLANRGRTALDMLEVDRPAVDFVHLARGFGVPAERVEDAGELVRALARSFAGDGPSLIEVQIG
jgi:acetolactate synthase-1/2/3 large subunit